MTSPTQRPWYSPPVGPQDDPVNSSSNDLVDVSSDVHASSPLNDPTDVSSNVHNSDRNLPKHQLSLKVIIVCLLLSIFIIMFIYIMKRASKPSLFDRSDNPSNSSKKTYDSQ
jgi:hypothetical protein